MFCLVFWLVTWVHVAIGQEDAACAVGSKDAAGTCTVKALEQDDHFAGAWWERARNAALAHDWQPPDEAAVHGALRGEGDKASDTRDSCKEAVGEPLSPVLSVEVALAVPSLQAGGQERVAFVLRNGENHGLFVRYREGCHKRIAHVGAVALGANSGDVARPLRIFSAGGQPVADAPIGGAVMHPLLLHVLLEGEAWVWPGIRTGFRWVVAGIPLETVSLAPRVILVRNFTTEADSKAIRKHGEGTLSRSPEKHYSPGYENYRTSSTGYIRSSVPAGRRIREKSWQIARLATLQHVEEPQLLRYQPPDGKKRKYGDWYKEHQDIFHNFTPLKGASNPSSLWLKRMSPLAASIRWHASLGIDGCKDLRGWNLVQLAVCQEMVAGAPRADGLFRADDDYRGWLKENIARCARGLLEHLLGSRPELLPVAQDGLAAVAASDKRFSALAVQDSDEESKHPPRFVRPNRHVTILVYLNHVKDGGETIFPRVPGIRRADMHPGMPDCARGLSVQPVAYGAAMFYHQHGNGSTDPLSAHGGCPPRKGEKWCINSFMWNVPFSEGIRYYPS